MRLGLTLIELLIVIAFIGFLGSMVLAAAGVVTLNAERTETEALLAKVDSAINQYADRFGYIPLPTWGKDVTNLEAANTATNKLFWRLGKQMTRQDRLDYEALVPAAVSAAESTVTPAEADLYRGGFTPAGAWRAWTGGSRNYQDAVVELLKLVKGEAAEIEVKRSWQTMDIISEAEIGRQFIKDNDASLPGPDTIVDSWGGEIVYITQYRPGIPYRDITVLPDWGYRYDTDKVGMKLGQRLTIVDANNDDSIEDDAAASDIRTHAFQNFETSFELWSPGPDGLFNAIRGELDNDDNVTATPYRSE